MADIKDVEFVFRRLSESQPREFNSKISDTHAGIGAVLKYLDESDKRVTCGDIAKKMNVSTARVAVLLKKMAAKDLIERNIDKDDARIIYVTLTEKGRETIAQIRDLIIDHLSKIIDVMGMEKIRTYIELSDEIKKVFVDIQPSPPDFLKPKK